MLSFRPKPSAHYLVRRRLLGLLPDEAGYVVWLEAPYGYGKSVLAGQWADALEAAGWRVVWLTLAGLGVKGSLATQLGLPEDAPWAVLLGLLWEHETLLVIEDLETLETHEELTPVLKDVRGLVLLASRGALVSPELPRLVTTKRLVHLTSSALAFTEDEAEALLDDGPRAHERWSLTHGWPLPLHFAVLTGELPEGGALLEGMRESLDEDQWGEALLLAALTHLPEGAATAATAALTASGFVQRVEAGYRLHALIADALVTTYGDDVIGAVRREAARLPPLQRAEAFERSGYVRGLADLLDDPTADLARHDAAAVVRWHELAPAASGAVRAAHVGEALCLLGQRESGLAHLEEAARAPEPDTSLHALGQLVWFLGSSDMERARQYAVLGEAHLGSADPERAARFLLNVSALDYFTNDYQAALSTVERALALYPRTSPYRSGALVNRALLRWHLYGDIEERMAAQAEALTDLEALYPDTMPATHSDLGRFHAYLGDAESALEHFRAAQRWAKASPLSALVAEAHAAASGGDLQPFPAVLARVRAWSHDVHEDTVRALWARTLRAKGRLTAATELLREDPLGYFCRLELALCLAAAGSTDEAVASLPDPQDLRDRERTLLYLAARYRVTRDESDLASLVDLTLVKERILPGLVPLNELPRGRPELATVYPLEEVLASGWREAVTLRGTEIPELELELLGTFRARVLGSEVGMAARQRQVLVLLVLGASRDVIGEELWPGLDPVKVGNNLNVQFNLLRKGIEPWGVRTYLTEEGLQRTAADVWSLREALSRRDTEEVLRLYRGPLAPGMDLPLADDARADLEQQVIDALLEAADDADAGDAYLERVLELDPVNETALQRLLTRLITRGRRQEAHRRYRAFAARLAEEMGLEPLPATSRLLD